MRKTGIVRDPRYLEHKTGIHHMEVPGRLEAIYSMINRCELKEQLIQVAPRFASLEELEMVHSPAYIEKIMDTAGEPLLYLDPDTVTSAQTCEAAFLAVGGVLEAVRCVMTGELDNAFALIRPPGHHAEKNRQMGFCVFNNVALAAEYARRRFGLSRVLIVDWDVHHANGTQHIFEQSPEVLVFSTHRFPFFPGTGSIEEVGTGDGRGFTVNVPLTPRKKDSDYAEIYEKILRPIALEFQPQLVLLSAGFDTHYDDPIGGMRITEHGYAYMTDVLLQIADSSCGGKLVAVLEGGYDLGAMRKSSKAVLEALLEGAAGASREKIEAVSDRSAVAGVIREAAKTQSPYWKCFSDV